MKIASIGELILKLHNDRVMKLTQVRYVPEVNRSLISLGKLIHLGYTVLMKNDMVEIIKRDLEILKSWKNKRNLIINIC